MQTQAISSKNILLDSSTKIFIKILLMIFLVAAIPALIHSQWIAGPLVNAILFLSAVYCGLSGAIFVGMIPSAIALSFGLLPAPLAPMVPYIILSNALLVVIFSFLRRRGFLLAAAAGGAAKFILLYSMSPIVANLLFNKKLAPQVLAMLSWPQLATALAGGIIAFVIFKGKTKLTEK